VKRWLRLGMEGCLLLALWGWWSPVQVHAEFYGDISTKRYHTADCPETPLIKAKNLKKFDSEAEARAKTFYPCPLCSALVRKEAAPVVQQRVLSRAISRSDGYVVDKATKTYHQTWCPLVKNMDPRQIVKVADIEKASAGGNAPCVVCNPPVPFVRAVTVTGDKDKNTAPVVRKAPAGAGGKAGGQDPE